MTDKYVGTRFTSPWREVLDRLLRRMAQEQGDPMPAVAAMSESLVEDAEHVLGTLDDFDGVSVSATEDGLEVLVMSGDMPHGALRGPDTARIRLEVAKVLMQVLDAYLEAEEKARDAAVRSLSGAMLSKG